MTVKFRFHRGGLAGSMLTVHEVESMQELVDHLRENWARVGYMERPSTENVEVKPYCDEPDYRIGWAKTMIVLVDGGPVGFTDGRPVE